MTREEELDWLCRLRSEIYVYMPKEWLIPMHDALDMAIKTLEQEPKTGHWKRISIDKYSEHAKYWYRCDRCGKDNLGNTDWCPNCGCRMVQERSE